MKELDDFTFEQLAKWIDAGKEAHDRHDGIRMAGVHVASLAKIALSAKAESEPHKRRETHAGGNTWIQCSKQAYDRAEAAGERVRILYERPALNSPETPDGWVMVPKEPTEHMIVCGFESEPNKYFSDKDDWKAYKEMSGCQQAAHRAKLCWNAMLAAAPKPEK